MTPAELASWLREHPDAVVFRCGCIWTEPTMAAISQARSTVRHSFYLGCFFPSSLDIVS